ncbi:MAG: hypothetical protein MRY21_06355 [Simkaniaceae bacterium]|nr:hypothetical protein [Simkaniaceae bacterium]
MTTTPIRSPQPKYFDRNYFRGPESKDLHRRKITHLALAILSGALMVTAIVISATAILNPAIFAAAAAVMGLVSAGLFFLGITSPQIIEHSKLIIGPYGGIFESDFLSAMNSNQRARLTPKKIEKSPTWAQIKANYDHFISSLKSTPAQAEPSGYKIPQNIHLIWLGNECPENERKVFEGWERMHPGWNAKLWGNEDAQALIDEFKAEFPNVKETYENAATYAEKADVIRLLALYKEGGFYCDTDLPCLGSLQELNAHASFYIGIQQVEGPFDRLVNNAAIAARPKHPIIKRCLEEMRPRNPGESENSILYRTGPGLLTRHALQGVQEDRENGTNETLLLPPGYFYPLHGKYSGCSQSQALAAVLPWTKGLHIWEGSWTNKST